MCGRFCCALSADEIRNTLYQENVLSQPETEWVDQDMHHSSYNVCPSRYVPSVLAKGQHQAKIMQSMKWGFIPSWAKNTPFHKPINARQETLLEEHSTMFDRSKNVNRCIIAAEGFFEWNKKKQAFYITRKDGKMMLFAGLYSASFVDAENITTCTLITIAASKSFSSIHHRMPVILEPEDVDTWINNKTRWSASVIKLLKPFEGELDCVQVSDKVGPTKNDSPELIKPLNQHKSSISHFLKPVDVKDEMNKNFSIIKHQNDPVVAEKKFPSSSPTSTFANQVDTKATRKRSIAPKQPTASKNPKITNFFRKK